MPFEPITATHFDQRYNNIVYAERQVKYAIIAGVNVHYYNNDAAKFCNLTPSKIL